MKPSKNADTLDSKILKEIMESMQKLSGNFDVAVTVGQVAMDSRTEKKELQEGLNKLSNSLAERFSRLEEMIGEDLSCIAC